jgi:membrane fusion protein (multidrug efflux system)
VAAADSAFTVRGSLVALALALAACGKQAPTQQPSAPPLVRTAPAVKADVEQTYEWLATLDGSTNAEIRPQVTGTITAVDYQEGTTVRDGMLLFTIDPRPFRAALQVATGNYQSAVAGLRKARADVARYRPLLAARGVSREQLENARASVNTYLGNIQTALGNLESARLNLEWTEVRSPIDGLAGFAQTRVGNLVTPSTVLAVVSTLDPIRASFSISERDYVTHADILNHINDPELVNRRYLELILIDGSVFPQRARRVIVNRQIDPSTGTLQIQALFPNPGNILRPGLFARIRLHTGVQQGTVLVPQVAVQQLQGTLRVTVVTPQDRVEIRQITVGQQHGRDYAVQSGLQAGEQVVVAAPEPLQPGQQVRVQPATPAAAQGMGTGAGPPAGSGGGSAQAGQGR